MKILLTGFDPFGGETVNPAFEAVKLLPDTIAGAEIVKQEVPTEFIRAGEVLEAAIQANQPDVVICIGQAGGRSAITPEKVAINLMDGVNGLSSGYCIMACTIFGILFHLAGEEAMTILAVVSVGALIPFFLHNVFGKSSKMFIGDGGTLVMGTVMSVFVIAILQSGSRVAAFVDPNVGLVPFTLAVLSVPVFDTLRVMSTRMLKGSSPFRPDKTHLHHMFIDMGCSHVATTLAILGLNTAVVLCWWVFEAAGFSISVQLYAVVGMSLLATFGLYHFMQWHIRRDTKFMGIIRRLGYKTHISRTGIFFWLQQVMDKV